MKAPGKNVRASRRQDLGRGLVSVPNPRGKEKRAGKSQAVMTAGPSGMPWLFRGDWALEALEEPSAETMRDRGRPRNAYCCLAR